MGEDVELIVVIEAGRPERRYKQSILEDIFCDVECLALTLSAPFFKDEISPYGSIKIITAS